LVNCSWETDSGPRALCVIDALRELHQQVQDVLNKHKVMPYLTQYASTSSSRANGWNGLFRSTLLYKPRAKLT
jgi:hypothetical protein